MSGIDAVKLVVEMIKQGNCPLPTKSQLHNLLEQVTELAEAYDAATEQLKYQVVQTKEFERQLDDMKEYHQQLIAKIAVMEVKLIEREDALYKLIDAADDSDGCGTLATNFVRDICKVALGVRHENI